VALDEALPEEEAVAVGDIDAEGVLKAVACAELVAVELTEGDAVEEEVLLVVAGPVRDEEVDGEPLTLLVAVTVGDTVPEDVAVELALPLADAGGDAVELTLILAVAVRLGEPEGDNDCEGLTEEEALRVELPDTDGEALEDAVAVIEAVVLKVSLSDDDGDGVGEGVAEATEAQIWAATYTSSL
jgi:hypothetical protein